MSLLPAIDPKLARKFTLAEYIGRHRSGFFRAIAQMGEAQQDWHKVFNGTDEPKFSTLIQFIQSLGLRMTVQPAAPEKAA